MSSSLSCPHSPPVWRGEGGHDSRMKGKFPEGWILLEVRVVKWRWREVAWCSVLGFLVKGVRWCSVGPCFPVGVGAGGHTLLSAGTMKERVSRVLRRHLSPLCSLAGFMRAAFDGAQVWPLSP